MIYKSLLFDLDGTITDSAEGVGKGAVYALENLGYTVPDDFPLKKFVGPPLAESFENYFGLHNEEIDRAIELYREYYNPIGIYENRVYDGMEKLLSNLNDAGYDILLATSKPEPQAKFVLDYFGLTKYFSYISACPLKEKGVEKADVIRFAFEHTKAKEKSEILMIGDTRFDINGAITCGIDSVGVLYGMGDEEELKNATYIVESVSELEELLLKKLV